VVNRRRSDNTMPNEKGQTRIYKTLCGKSKFELHESRLNNLGWFQVQRNGKQFLYQSCCPNCRTHRIWFTII